MASHPSESIAQSAVVHETAVVWEGTQIREHAQIGERVSIGRGCYVGIGVHIGAFSKIQNFAQIFDPAEIGAGVFIGPGVILTNDRYPRAVNPDFSAKSASDWKPAGVAVNDGASIGAGAICIGPISIGSWAMVAAGAVVTRDVARHELVGGVPARRLGWIGESGQPLAQDATDSALWRCPSTGFLYTLDGDTGTLSRRPINSSAI